MSEHGRIKLFADGAVLDELDRLIDEYAISGFTTNPTLMRAAGVSDYMWFASEMLSKTQGLPVSFEVFADDFPGMERQAIKLANLDASVYVKIPVTDTEGVSSVPLIRHLQAEGVKVNVTAVFTPEQVDALCEAINGSVPTIISIFAGRIADSGRDAVAHVRGAVERAREHPEAEVLWASSRQIYDVVSAESAGCDIITITHDLLPKLRLLGKDLGEFSLDTVRMFHRDAKASGYSL